MVEKPERVEEPAAKSERDDTRPLSFVVESEARRQLSESQIQADPERLRQGWTRRFVAGGVRAQEMISLYEELGFEVVGDPIRGEHLGDTCEDCRLIALQQFRMIYTRESSRRARRFEA